MPLPVPKLGKAEIERKSTFVATDDAMDAIVEDIRGMSDAIKKTTDLELSNSFFAFAVYCADNGSSDKQVYNGTCDLHGDESISYSTLTTLIRRQCTIRQFCGYYAQNVWNYLIENGPPMNWEKKNFTPSTKYAAFDFFDAVSVRTAASPETLIREPTLDEINANKTNGHAAIVTSRATEGSVYSTNALVHGGRGTGSSARYNLPFAIPSVSAP
jgi:hypothetical protein